MIAERIEAHVRSKSKRYPCHANRASAIGDSCERKLVYHRVAWERAALPDARLMLIFAEGDLHEKAVLNLMQEAGFSIYEQQAQFSDRKASLTGHVDFVGGVPPEWAVEQGLIRTADVCKEGEFLFPADIKSMSEHIWRSINSPADFNNPKKPWLMKYPAQLQCYMYFKGMEWGCLVCKNKSTGEIKEIWIPFSFEQMDALLKKAERINETVRQWDAATNDKEREELLPARITDLDQCKYCDFSHVCRPTLDFGAPIKIEDDPQFVDKLTRRMELSESAAEFSKLDKEIKEQCKASAKAGGGERFCQMSGDWVINGKKNAAGSWLFGFEWVGEKGQEKIA